MMKRKQWSAKSFKALGWGIVLLVLSHLGLAVAIDHWLPSFRDSLYGPKAVRLLDRLRAPDFQREGKGRQGKVVLMLGNSHVANALNGSQMEAELAGELAAPLLVHNFGCPNAGNVTDYLNLVRLLHRQVQPDLVLLEVFPEFLSGPGPTELGSLPVARLEHNDLVPLEKCRFPIVDLRSSWWQAWLMPWYSHRFSILNSTFDWLLPPSERQDWSFTCDAWGWKCWPEVSAERRAELTRSTLRILRPYFQNYCLADSSCEAVRQTLAECQARHIAAAIVLMPEGAPVRGLYSATVHSQLRAFLEEVSKQFRVDVVDARNWMADSDFTDGHHLSDTGAGKFTHRLGREVVLPQLMRAK